MVIARVVRITNNTQRTFHVQSGDFFYTPKVDEVPCVNGAFEVPPGFDKVCDGLVVPWSSATAKGLTITEECSRDPAERAPPLRCVVAPLPSGQDVEGREWLQFRAYDWQPLAQDRWMPLGRRHTMGMIGGAVELMLTFRDDRAGGLGSKAELYELFRFDRAGIAAHNDVMLNLYDLTPAFSLPNAVLCNTIYTSMGAFHAGVEVFSDEWSFFQTANPTSSGVLKSPRPRHHPVHVYRQSLWLGRTDLKDWEVRDLIYDNLAPTWLGGDYHLLERNCIHFSDTLLLALGVKPVPFWVSRLHATGSSLLRFVLGGSDDRPRVAALEDDDEDEEEDEPIARDPEGFLLWIPPGELEVLRTTTPPALES